MGSCIGGSKYRMPIPQLAGGYAARQNQNRSATTRRNSRQPVVYYHYSRPSVIVDRAPDPPEDFGGPSLLSTDFYDGGHSKLRYVQGPFDQ